MGWKIDTEASIIALPKRKIQELNQLLAIPATQQHIGRNYVDIFLGKLRSMHVAVLGAVAHLYDIHSDLAQGGVWAWLSPVFHR